ncbi:hypothetical protein C0Z10_01335 [Acidipropionibacterium jensenii]|uniref:Uncharacterized protein n=2 Tax=Acidipropionibacterium jensenii TaxID=1749 RepID=A0A3T0RWK1_9ACTN|nr:hypothetical protein C0Z10_01335 [Acidipropionibacterium jensenii]
MAGPGEIATRGVATLGSAISGDWLGVGASVLSILRESLQGTDAEVWRKHLEKLARRGWQNAADARVTYKHLGAEADQDTSVAYVMSCLHAGTSPTAEGLIAFPGVGLVDATDLGEPMAMESAKDAANRFLSMMIGSLLSDRTFVVQNNLVRVITESQEARTHLEADVARHGASVATLQSRVTELRTAISLLSAPGLRAQQREVRGDGLLDFLSGEVAFHGRDDVLAELIAFCESAGKNWRWLALTGAGGSGKSRLAFELCLQLRQRKWDAFFLDRRALTSAPPAALASAPTDLLIVLDYVAFAPDQVANWLAQLPVNPARRLRVLLVERAGWPTTDLTFRPPAWYGELVDAWSAADLRQHLYELPSGRIDVALTGHPLSPTDFDAILASIEPADAIPAGVRQAIITRLQTVIDPLAQRPLFLLFLASAYLDDPSDARWQTWSTTDLHDVIYQRERQRLVHQLPEGFDDVALDLWAFATATLSPINDIYADAPDWLIAPLADQPVKIRRKVQQALRASCGDAGADVRPYTPDIPGEYMVVARLSEWREANRKLFVDTAWALFPEGFGTFLTRALTDLDPASAVAQESLSSTGLLAIPDAERDTLTLTKALESLIDPANPRPDVAEILTSAADRFRSSPEITKRAVHAIISCSSPEMALPTPPGDRPNWHEGVRQTFPGLDAAQQERLAAQLRPVLVLWTGTVLALGLTQAEMDEFDGLSDSAQLTWLGFHRPDYGSVVLRCTTALLSAAVAVAAEMSWLALDGSLADWLEDASPWSPIVVDEATRPVLIAQSLASRTGKPNVDAAEIRTIISQLNNLTHTYPDNADVALQYAKALFNLTAKPGVDAVETRTITTTLANLTTDHPGNPDITLEYARALFNLTAKPGVDAVETRTITTTLANLTTDHPGNPDITLRYARALVNLTAKPGVDAVETRTITTTLANLTTDHPGNPDITLEYAKALVNLTAKPGVDAVETRTITTTLANLTTDHPGNPDITLEYAKALVNLTAKPGVDAVETRTITTTLANLTTDHPGNPDITLEYAKALFNLTAKPGVDAVETRTITTTLANLTTDHPGNPDITLEYAKALFNLTAKPGVDAVETRTITTTLANLTTDHPGNPDITLRYAKALFNLTVEPGVEAVETRTITTTLANLTTDHPGNPDITLRYAKALVNLTYKAGVGAVETRTITTTLANLTTDHPGNPDITLRYARALFNLTAKPGVDAVETRTITTTLANLTTDHPGNPDITLRYARALFNLTAKPGVDAVETRTITTTLANLTTDHPGNPDITLEYARALFNLTAKPGVDAVETRTITTTLANLTTDHPGNPDITLQHVVSLVGYAWKADFDVSQTASVLNQLNHLIEGLSRPDSVGYTVDFLRGFLDDEDVTQLPEFQAAAVAELGEGAPFSQVLTALLETAIKPALQD